jgi:hypothetical protein
MEGGVYNQNIELVKYFMLHNIILFVIGKPQYGGMHAVDILAWKPYLCPSIDFMQIMEHCMMTERAV